MEYNEMQQIQQPEIRSTPYQSPMHNFAGSIRRRENIERMARNAG